jgi:alcohol-forming fatty acyl-CoA reductase
MLRVQRKVSDGLDALQFFTTRQWDFKSHAFQAIQKELPEVDQKQYALEFF